MKKVTTAAVQSFIDDDVPKPLQQFIKEQKVHRLRQYVHRLTHHAHMHMRTHISNIHKHQLT